MDNPFAKESYGQIALQKMGQTDPNFILYEAGWLETGGAPCTWDVFEVKGALFREAKRGPRKGEVCVIVKGTKQTAYVTKAEMKAWEEKNTPEYSYEVNHCECPPETCACDPFKIVDREGNKLSTAFNEDHAKKVVEILNK